MYTNLNDAAKVSHLLSNGKVSIWYYKDENSRDACMGREFCDKHGFFQIDPKNLAATHVNLGCIRATVVDDGVTEEVDLEEIFSLMQGETWSPQGEARNMLRAIGISHTSMSMGDIIEFNGDVFIVDNYGFVKL